MLKRVSLTLALNIPLPVTFEAGITQTKLWQL